MAKKFKTYNQQQNWLFPPSIEEMIPDDHPVRIVNGVIEKINLQNLLESYSNDGASSYHPKMLLKVMIYAYMDNTYSSRKIEKRCVRILIICGYQIVPLLIIIH